MTRWALAVAMVGLLGCSDDGTEGPAPGPVDALSCQDAAAQAVRTCVADYSAALEGCYASSDEACGDNDASTATALDSLSTSVEGACGDAGIGGLDVDATVGRLRNACASEASSLAWRVYGGPQGAAWQSASDAERGCLTAAHQAAVGFVDASLQANDSCLAGEDCDAASVAVERATLASSAEAEVQEACADLDKLIAVDPAMFTTRAAGQADCLTAATHADTAELPLRCGPSHAQFEAPRGEWTRIEVDGDTWGTLCGDGSPYAFFVRFAPEGEPLDRLVIGLQGGGVCLFEEDCAARFQTSPGLFTAEDDVPPNTGIMADDVDESPFANWTRVFLPYCTQDVFAGGGVEEELGTITVPRYGSVNMRAATQMLRDTLWKMMDEEGGAGFRPDEVVAMFGGWSAGGYGTLYNYHWLIDDLQWPRTSAFPDAGLGLDNGTALGVQGLGLIKVPAWGMRPNLPPYCFSGDCAGGKVLFEALSPRLLQVPEQQILALSNPLDTTQEADAFFEESSTFINTLRSTYCDTKDLPGIQWYLTSTSTESVHVVSLRPEHWSGSVDGEVMRDWMWGAVTDAENVVDRAEEADFVTAVPGVMEFPCSVAP
jgi:Pectinacetylesterase